MKKSLFLLVIFTALIFIHAQDASLAKQPVTAESKIISDVNLSFCDYNSTEFTAIDTHAMAAPRAVLGSVENLAEYLIKPAKNDLEKVRAIYRWITDNISYNLNAYYSGRYGDLSAAGVLRSKKSVCSGYSALFQALSNEAGIEVVTLNGYAKGLSYRKGSRFKRTNHAWNAVKLDGNWYLIDSTWGAGYASGRRFHKKFEEFWFLTPPEGFIFSHLSSTPEWQLLEEPIDMKRFIELPNLKSSFFSLGFELDKAYEYLEGDDYRGFPTVYGQKVDIELIDFPITKYLSKDDSYTFSLKIDKAKSVAVINNGKWTHLRKLDGIWSGSISPQKGAVEVYYSTKGRSSQHWGILKYIAE